MKTLPGPTSVSQLFSSTLRTRKTGSPSGPERIESLFLSRPAIRLPQMMTVCTLCGMDQAWRKGEVPWVLATGLLSTNRKTWLMTPSSTRRLWSAVLMECVQQARCSEEPLVIASTVWMGAISWEASTLLSLVTRQPPFWRSIVRLKPEDIFNKIMEFTVKYKMNEWRIEKNAMNMMVTQSEPLREFLASRGC